MSEENISVVLDLDDRQFKVKIKDATGSINKFGDHVEKSAAILAKMERRVSGTTGKLRDFVVTTSLASGAIRAMWSITGQWQLSILQATAGIERLTIMMEGMSTATTLAGRKLDALNDTKFLTEFAQNAPFKIEALTDTFVKLKSVGIDPTKGAMQSLTNAVAQFGGSGEVLKRASVAIQQMRGKGVVSMEELRQQLGEAVPQAMNIMASSMHMNMSEFVKAVSTGTVQSEVAIDKMLAEFSQRFGTANERMMLSWNGTMQALQSRWQLFLNDVGQSGGYFDEVKDSVRDLSDFLTTDTAKNWAKSFGQALASIIRAVKQATQFVAKFQDEIKAVATILATGIGIKVALKLLNNLSSAAQRGATLIALMGTNARRGAVQIGQFGAAVTMSGNAITRLQLALSAAGRAFTLLLGPIGLVAVALYELSNLFPSTAEAADKAMRAIQNSVGGSAATKKGHEDMEAKVKSLRKELGGLTRDQLEAAKPIRSSNRSRTSGDRSFSERLKNHGGLTKREVKQAAAALDELDKLKRNMAISSEVLSQRADTQERAHARELSNRVNASISLNEARYNKTMNQIDKEREAKGDAFTEEAQSERHISALREKNAKDMLSFDKALGDIDVKKSRLAKIREQDLTEANKSEIKALNLATAAISAKRVEQERANRSAIEMQKVSNKFIVDAGKDMDKAVKMQRTQLRGMVSSLATQLATLKAQLAGDEGTAEKIEQRLRNIARLQDEASNKGLSNEQLQAKAIQLAKEIDLTKTLIDNAKELARHQEQAATKAESAVKQMNAFVIEQSKIGMSDSGKAKVDHESRIAQMKKVADSQFLVGEKRKEAQAALESYILASEKRMAHESRNALEILADDYANSSSKMHDVFANAMGNMTDEIVNFAKTGKFEFGDLVQSVLSDLLKLQVQKTITGPLSDSLSGLFSGGGGGGAGGGIGGFLSSLWPFENGGIMTPYGKADFRAYETGGIANSPQIALYGEGSMNEAYVPLPDGKTIPVTMKGGMGGNVEVNIINNTDSRVDSNQAQPRFDGQKMILDVVLEAANKPGSFRSGMKGALS